MLWLKPHGYAVRLQIFNFSMAIYSRSKITLRHLCQYKTKWQEIRRRIVIVEAWKIKEAGVSPLAPSPRQ
jgi:hypothetical protein